MISFRECASWILCGQHLSWKLVVATNMSQKMKGGVDSNARMAKNKSVVQQAGAHLGNDFLVCLIQHFRWTCPGLRTSFPATEMALTVVAANAHSCRSGLRPLHCQKSPSSRASDALHQSRAMRRRPRPSLITGSRARYIFTHRQSRVDTAHDSPMVYLLMISPKESTRNQQSDHEHQHGVQRSPSCTQAAVPRDRERCCSKLTAATCRHAEIEPTTTDPVRGRERELGLNKRLCPVYAQLHPQDYHVARPVKRVAGDDRNAS